MAIRALSIAPAALYFSVILPIACGFPRAVRAGPLDAIEAPLTNIGINPSLIYDGSLAAVPSGGRKRGAAYIGNIRLQFSINGDQLIGVPGLSAYVEGLDVHGGHPSDYAGDAQGVSALEAASTFRLYEAWFQFNFGGNRFSVLGGRYDLNTEFDRTQSADLFLNSSFGIGPAFSRSGLDGPSIFPDTFAGVRLTYKPLPNIIWRTAVMNGSPGGTPAASGIPARHDGTLVVSEFAYLYRGGPAIPPSLRNSLIGRGAMLPPYQDKFAIGAWYYTAAFDDLSQMDALGRPLRHRGSRGAYLVVDKMIYRLGTHPDRAVTAFIQAGIGDARVDRFGSYIGAGIEAAGLSASRPQDEIGAAVAIARNGSHYMAAQAALGTPARRAEIAYEVTYLAQIADWIALQPDIQYVVHPDTDPETGDALVIQAQFEFTF